MELIEREMKANCEWRKKKFKINQFLLMDE